MSTTRSTEAGYLRYDLDREGKHEFVNGEIVAMAGAEPRHARVRLRLGDGSTGGFGPP